MHAIATSSYTQMQVVCSLLHTYKVRLFGKHMTHAKRVLGDDGVSMGWAPANLLSMCMVQQVLPPHGYSSVHTQHVSCCKRTGATADYFLLLRPMLKTFCIADLKNSFFVGDAAGRTGDFADSDK